MSIQSLAILFIILGGGFICTIVVFAWNAFRQRALLMEMAHWLDALPDPVIVFDQEQRIVKMNAVAESLTGITFRVADGHQNWDVLPDWLKKIECFPRDRAMSLEIQVERAGQTSWYQLLGTPLTSRDNRPSGSLVILHEMTTFKQIEHALEANQDLFHAITNQADDGIAIIQNDLVVFINPRLLAMTGYLPADLLYQNFELFILPHHSEALRGQYRKRAKGETAPMRFETAVIRKDGKRLPVEIKIGSLKFEGKPSALVALQDISTQKRVERQLSLQSQALQSAANAFLITDQNGDIQWINAAFTQMTGYEYEEIVGQTPRFLKSGKQNNAFYRNLWETIQSGKVWKGEIVNRQKNGQLYDEYMTISPVKDEWGKITHYVAVKENISARKRTEKALRKSEYQFRELVWNTPIPMKVYGNDHQLILVNARFTEVFGYEKEEISTIEDWWNLAIPNETARLQIKTEWQNLFDAGSVESTGHKPIETEVICKDGSKRVVNFSLVPLENKYILALMDRTKQKRAEEHLRRRARHLMLLNEITLSALESFDLGTLCQMLADRMGEFLEADGCFIVLWDETNKKPIPMAAYGPMRDTYRDMAQRANNEPTLTASVIQMGHAIAVENVYDSPYMSPRIASQFPTRSMLGLPLIADHRRIGAALISFENPHIFTQDEIVRGEQAALQVALAIAKTRLVDAEREKHQLSLALVEISTLLSVKLSVEAFLSRAIELLQRVVPYDAGSIYLIQDGRTKGLLTRGYEQFGKELPAFVQNLEMEVAKTPTLQMMVNNCRPVLIPDTEKDPTWIQYKPAGLFRSFAGAPIHIEGKVLAIFFLEKREPNFFRPEHAGRLAAFAGQAAIALENARLFEEIRQLAIVDPLTGGATRRHILEIAIREIERSQRYHHTLCVIMLDVDHFKRVNDAFGHQVGDQVLQSVIILCKGNLRKTDFIGRYGGEEFLILLPETEIDQAIYIAERIRGQIENMKLDIEGNIVSVTVSIGACQLEEKPEQMANELLKGLINQADQALYIAKQTGRNCVVRYSSP